MSNGAYSPDKAAMHPERLKLLREGGNPYPVHLHLIVADLCNLDCPGCAYRMSGYSSNQMFAGPNGERNPSRFLAAPTVRKILADCRAMGTRAVEFTGGGEPTLHPEIGEFLETAQTLGLDTALITNGLLLRRRAILPVASRTVWTRISIDAATPEVYGKVRPGLGRPHGEQIKTVLDNLTALRNARDTERTGCTIGAGFVVQKDNWHEIYEAVRIYREAGADNVRISGLFTPEGDNYHAGYFKYAQELERKATRDFDGKGGFRVYGRFAEKVDDLHGPPTYQTCHYQRFTTYVGGDGNVYRCCVTSYNKHGLLASLHDYGDSLMDLWDAPEVREKLAHFDARSCSRCQFNDRNKAIDALLKLPNLPPPPAGIVHPSFV